jgi:hypothetical protein
MDPFVDEGVATDDAIGPQAGAVSKHRSVPDTRPRANRDVGFEVCGRMHPCGGIDHERLL